MATYNFDITQKVGNFALASVQNMAGNPGQQVLLQQLTYTGKVIVSVITVEIPTRNRNTIELPINVYTTGYIKFNSSHPEAISIIMKKAEDNAEVIIKNSEILGPWSLANALLFNDWKICGLDQANNYYNKPDWLEQLENDVRDLAA